MKKLLIIIGSILMFCQAEAQVGISCPVCPPVLIGVTNGSVLRDSSGKATWQLLSGLDTNAVDVNALNYWSLTGNAGTNPATDFVGTTDGANFRIQQDSNEILLKLKSGIYTQDYYSDIYTWHQKVAA